MFSPSNLNETIRMTKLRIRVTWVYLILIVLYSVVSKKLQPGYTLSHLYGNILRVQSTAPEIGSKFVLTAASLELFYFSRHLVSIWQLRAGCAARTSTARMALRRHHAATTSTALQGVPPERSARV